jgi:hypothetical protein
VEVLGFFVSRTGAANFAIDASGTNTLFNGSGYGVAHVDNIDFNNSSGIFQAASDLANNLFIDFTNSSGVFTNNINNNTVSIADLLTDFQNSSGVFQNSSEGFDQLLLDFTNSSGVFTNDIAINAANITNITNNFNNSSGVFQAGVDLANQTATDFVNSSGVFASDIQSNTTAIANLNTDFANSSGIFQQAVDDVAQLRIDFTNSSGVFTANISANTASIDDLRTDFSNSSGIFQNAVDNLAQLQTDFDNSSGVFANDISTNASNIADLLTDFTNSSGVFVKDGEQLGTSSSISVDIFKQKDADQNLEFRMLQVGSGLRGLQGAGDVFIDNDVIYENLGSGSGILKGRTGTVSVQNRVEFRSIVPGSNIGINQSADELEIFSTAPGGGEANTASNVGIGTGEVFAQKSGVDLEFRQLLQGSGLQIATSGNTVRFDWTHLDDFESLQSDVTTNTNNITTLRSDFDNSSGVFRSDIDTLRTDFDNSSGIFQGAVNDVSQLRTDFDNSSGVFQGGVDTANQVRLDFDNSSGVFRSDIDTNASNISTNAGNISTNTTNIAANTSDIADIRTTQGTSDGDTNLGTFTGSVIRSAPGS